jgi:hypothetical protein
MENKMEVTITDIVEKTIQYLSEGKNIGICGALKNSFKELGLSNQELYDQILADVFEIAQLEYPMYLYPMAVKMDKYDILNYRHIYWFKEHNNHKVNQAARINTLKKFLKSIKTTSNG